MKTPSKIAPENWQSLALQVDCQQFINAWCSDEILSAPNQNEVARMLDIQKFQQQVINWQQSHGRNQLPWQQYSENQATAAYRVLVSELMLQQTQVATVIPYFQRWMDTFPSIQALANADEDEVMRLWQGLGYYARARNLHKAAKYLAELHEFPATLAELLQVPGVGRYTAGAIMSFAFNQYGPIVDGNVRRLYCRFFALAGAPHTTALEKQLWQKAHELTPVAHSRGFSQGLLDLGATVCKARQPLCEQCPLANDCQALLQNRVSEFPHAKIKKTVPTKTGSFLWINQGDAILLQKRPSPGIWGALWCLPQVANDSSLLAGATLHGEFSHQFTHYKLDAQIWQLSAEQYDANLRQAAPEIWATPSQLAMLGLPAPLKTYLQEKFNAPD